MCDFRRFAIGQGVKIVFYKYNIKVLYNRTLTLKITCFLFYLHVSGIPSLFKQKNGLEPTFSLVHSHLHDTTNY